MNQSQIRTLKRRINKNGTPLSKKRAAALLVLGNQCIRCGFQDKRALQIDHIYGNGAEERRLHGARTGLVVYEKILNGDSDYQILCANCNWIKRAENNENKLGREAYRKMANFVRRVVRRRDGIIYDLSGVPR